MWVVRVLFRFRDASLVFRSVLVFRFRARPAARFRVRGLPKKSTPTTRLGCVVGVLALSRNPHPKPPMF